ncbi:MAG: hypothetical protein R3C26_14545 [Calditrichia bacterium]
MSIDNAAPETLRDPHSFAHADEVVMTHLIGTPLSILRNTGLWQKPAFMLRNKTGAKRLFLDARDLTIDNNLGDDETENHIFDRRNHRIHGSGAGNRHSAGNKIVHVLFICAEAAALHRLTAEQNCREKAPVFVQPVASYFGANLIPR